LEPDDARTRDMLGVVLARQGRLSEAIEQFELATRLDPAYEAARVHLLKAQQVATGTSGRSPAAP
ncbi:MAG TPA: tetratricopeptide repeat protein, partial [Vicinamibacterales bacterium]|nr:tetratricopeptide repeat protein [Vicinamibacterales bacterium]